ncbi:MAG: ketosteroid isomerase-like protein [Zhongshania sp.]|jgi:ketosteroid isomerase-like protein|nr:nuclear transport factor 2 family protein [Zhongshania sp.]
MNDNKMVVMNFFEAFSSGDVERTMAFLSDHEFEWWISGNPAVFPLAGSRDKAGFGQLLNGVVENCKDGIKIKVLATTAEGERVAVEAESYAEVAGKIYNNLYHFLILIRDGKIIKVKEYLDTMHANDVLC